MGEIAQRPPADKDGDEIISSILTNPAAQLERGTYEVNHNMDDRVIVTGKITGLQFIAPGSMIKVVIKGIEKIGLVVDCRGKVAIGKNLDIQTQITVETIK